jgi:protein-S-isoprenylcysteine O-methyltransferase Ste14
MLPIVFTSTSYGILFYILYGAWLFSEIIGATILPRLLYGARRGERRDRGSFVLNIVTLFLAISIDFVIAIKEGATLPVFLYYVGIALMVGGLVLRQWAIAVLGRFFTMTVKVQSDHTLVESGPYRLLRHPSYTDLLLVILGIPLTLQTLLGVIVNLIIFGVAFGYRIYLEEKALRSKLGERYVEYSKRTKRLIPYLL